MILITVYQMQELQLWERTPFIMKKISVLIFLLSPVWMFAQEHPEMKAIRQAEQQRAELSAQFRGNPLTQDYDVVYHHLSLEVDPAISYINGQVTTWFRPQIPGLDVLHFDLYDGLSIDSIHWHHQACPYTLSNNTLTIDLPQLLTGGILDSVTIWYRGEPSTSGFGSFNKSTHNNTPVLWTLSEPYGARDWWPCKQDLTDKADSVDVIITTPGMYRAASNGLLVEEYPLGDQKVYHWQHRYPIAAYLVAFAVTDYAVYSDFVPTSGNPIEVLNYVYPEHLASAQAATTAIVPVMQLYNDLFGLYPFAKEKYGHAQFGWGGGMEHQTMSFMVGFSHLLQAHELAHQWFGDKVTCASWEDIWLNEGFATYLEGLTYEHGIGPTDWMDWKQGKINHIISAPDGSVWVNDTTSVSRIFSSRLSYSKGAMVLHMLRWELGDSAFFQGVRNYLNDPQNAYAYGQTQELINHLEASSGLDLTPFVQNWFYDEGYPTYSLNWSRHENEVILQVDQTTSHPSVAFFPMTLPIRILGTAGQDTIVRLSHSYSGESFLINLPWQATELQFDPELWLVKGTTQMTVGIEDPSWSTGISLFPNPIGSSHLTILSPNNPIQRLTIIDQTGHSTIVSCPHDQTRLDIPANQVPEGPGYLLITTAKGRLIRKTIK